MPRGASPARRRPGSTNGHAKVVTAANTDSDDEQYAKPRQSRAVALAPSGSAVSSVHVAIALAVGIVVGVTLHITLVRSMEAAPPATMATRGSENNNQHPSGGNTGSPAHSGTNGFYSTPAASNIADGVTCTGLSSAVCRFISNGAAARGRGGTDTEYDKFMATLASVRQTTSVGEDFFQTPPADSTSAQHTLSEEKHANAVNALYNDVATTSYGPEQFCAFVSNMAAQLLRSLITPRDDTRSATSTTTEVLQDALLDTMTSEPVDFDFCRSDNNHTLLLVKDVLFHTFDLNGDSVLDRLDHAAFEHLAGKFGTDQVFLAILLQPAHGDSITAGDVAQMVSQGLRGVTTSRTFHQLARKIGASIFVALQRKATQPQTGMLEEHKNETDSSVDLRITDMMNLPVVAAFLYGEAEATTWPWSFAVAEAMRHTDGVTKSALADFCQWLLAPQTKASTTDYDYVPGFAAEAITPVLVDALAGVLFEIADSDGSEILSRDEMQVLAPPPVKTSVVGLSELFGRIFALFDLNGDLRVAVDESQDVAEWLAAKAGEAATQAAAVVVEVAMSSTFGQGPIAETLAVASESWELLDESLRGPEPLVIVAVKHAIETEDVAAVERFIAAGLDVPAKLVALDAAVAAGKNAICRVLLESKLPSDALSGYLPEIAALGDVDDMRVWHKAGAQVNATDTIAVIKGAISSGNEDMVRLVLPLKEEIASTHLDLQLAGLFADAVATNKAAIVSILLEAGGKIPADDGDSLLEAAAQQSNAAIAGMVIDAGFNGTEALGRSLVAAVRADSISVVQLLLGAGADAAANAGELLPLAVKCINTEVLRVLIAAGANGAAELSEALAVAAAAGSKSNFGALLSAGARVLPSHDVTSWALAAVDAGNADMLELLLQRARPSEHALSTELLPRAVKEGAQALVKVLINAGAPVRGPNGAGGLLAEAVKLRQREIIETLAAAGARPGRRDLEIVQEAVRSDDIALLDTVLMLEGLDHSDLRVALEMAVVSGKLALVKELVNGGATVGSIGGTLAMKAVRPDDGAESEDVAEMLRLLKEAGATKDDLTEALRTEVRHRGPADVIDALLHLGADARATSGSNSLLHTALMHNDPDSVRLLLKHGANGEEPMYMQGRPVPPLVWAFKEDKFRLFESLLTKVDPDVMDPFSEKHRTLLMQAAAAENDEKKEYVRVLMAAGASATRKDARGKTAIDLATGSFGFSNNEKSLQYMKLRSM